MCCKCKQFYSHPYFIKVAHDPNFLRKYSNLFGIRICFAFELLFAEITKTVHLNQSYFAGDQFYRHSKSKESYI